MFDIPGQSYSTWVATHVWVALGFESCWCVARHLAGWKMFMAWPFA